MNRLFMDTVSSEYIFIKNFFCFIEPTNILSKIFDKIVNILLVKILFVNV